MTFSGHHCRMPLVEAKKVERHPIVLKRRASCVYILNNALLVPGCMPCSRAMRSTTFWGIELKHFRKVETGFHC